MHDPLLLFIFVTASGLFVCLLYTLREMYSVTLAEQRILLQKIKSVNENQPTCQSDARSESLSDLQSNGAIAEQNHPANIQNEATSPEQIYIVADDPMHIHSNHFLDSMALWLEERLDNPPDTYPCLYFWCQESEMRPKAFDVIRYLYFRLNKHPGVFNAVSVVFAPDLLFLAADMTFYRFYDGSVKGYMNQKTLGDFHPLLKYSDERCHQLVNSLRFWCQSVMPMQLRLDNLLVDDFSPFAKQELRGKHAYISTWRLDYQSFVRSKSRDNLDFEIRNYRSLSLVSK